MIIWGKKYVYTRLGYVADFCYLCREVRPFELERIGLAGHIYYVSLTQGELVGHRRRCTTCGTEFDAAAERYARTLKERRPVRELLPQTFPDLARHHAGRFALEKAIRDAFTKLSAADRDALLKEPFKLLAYKAEDRFRNSSVLAGSSAVFFGSMIALGPLVMLLARAAPDYEGEILAGMVVVAAIGTWIFSVWLRGRLLRKDVLPPLASALHPLRPTREELAAVLKDMKALGLKIGKRLSADAVLAAVKSYAPPARAA